MSSKIRSTVFPGEDGFHVHTPDNISIVSISVFLSFFKLLLTSWYRICTNLLLYPLDITILYPGTLIYLHHPNPDFQLLVMHDHCYSVTSVMREQASK